MKHKKLLSKLNFIFKRKTKQCVSLDLLQLKKIIEKKTPNFKTDQFTQEKNTAESS